MISRIKKILFFEEIPQQMKGKITLMNTRYQIVANVLLSISK